VRRHPALPGQPRASLAITAALGAAPLASVSTCGIDPTSVPELIELTRALRNDPDLIYQFVHDNIEFTPIGGALKGPLGTLLDGRGSAYDQATLMVVLLQRAALSNSSISNPRFEFGQITLNHTQLENWLGVDSTFYSLAYLLGSGGINGVI